jgi:bifunctional DNase/RNase
VQVVGIFGERLDFAGEEHQIPLLVLRDDASRELRVPVSQCEGIGIHIAVEEQTVPRPLTHDLAVRIIEKLSASIERVVIDQLSDDASHAAVYLRTQHGSLALDARPGDAVALAVRAGAPVFVKDALLDHADLGGDNTP